MLFADLSYEQILQRMINRVLEYDRNIDTRPSSPVYNALAPAAMELMNVYIQLDWFLNQTFADTAEREFLIKRAAERGIIVELATFSIRQGEFNIDVPIGARFTLRNTDLVYIATEKISNGIFKMKCETAGVVGNEVDGQLIPIEYINGLESAQLTDVLIPARDDEPTERLRQRYFDSLNAQAYGGNVQDYRDKTNALTGVGGVKVYPVWNGGGTVKLVIIGDDYKVPSDVLVNEVQTAIDPTQNEGEGLGIAPIGHVVTVEGVSSTTVGINTSITFQDGWDWEAIKPYVEQAVDTYFLELAEQWDSQDNLIVRISQIETRLLDLTGVIDVGGTTINGLAENLMIGANSVPIRGQITNA